MAGRVGNVVELSPAGRPVVLIKPHSFSAFRGRKLRRMVKVIARRDVAGWTCEVDVEAGGMKTRHTVRVGDGDVARWADGDGESAVTALVARSFDFLLQRESPSSILRRFDLAVIQSYFPEYDLQFRR
jgi:hypothetical protein